MKYLLLLLLLTGNAGFATSSTTLDKLTNQELCAALSMELEIAVRLGTITESEMAAIELNCYRN